METYGTGGKKCLANDSVSPKAQQIGVFMINTILLPIHKPYFNKSHLFVSLVILLDYNCNLSFNDKLSSPQVSSTGFGEVNSIEISKYYYYMCFIKILAAIAEVKLP